MRAKAFSRLAFAFALASLASTFTLAAADECGASSSGRIRAQGFGLPQTADLIEWYEASAIDQANDGTVSGWTSTVANTYNGGACFFSQVESQQLPTKRSEIVCDRARRY